MWRHQQLAQLLLLRRMRTWRSWKMRRARLFLRPCQWLQVQLNGLHIASHICPLLTGALHA